MFGVKDFTAVINPPHSTILAVGSGEQRAVVKNGAVDRGDDHERDACPATTAPSTVRSAPQLARSPSSERIEKPMGMLV